MLLVVRLHVCISDVKQSMLTRVLNCLQELAKQDAAAAAAAAATK